MMYFLARRLAFFFFFQKYSWFRNFGVFSSWTATIEKEMRKLFNIPAEKETRLWNRYMSNTFEQLSKPDSTVQDAGLYHGQVRGISPPPPNAHSKGWQCTLKVLCNLQYKFSRAMLNLRNSKLRDNHVLFSFPVIYIEQMLRMWFVNDFAKCVADFQLCFYYLNSLSGCSNRSEKRWWHLA